MRTMRTEQKRILCRNRLQDKSRETNTVKSIINSIKGQRHSHLRHTKRPMAVREGGLWEGGGLSNGRFPWTKWES